MPGNWGKNVNEERKKIAGGKDLEELAIELADEGTFAPTELMFRFRFRKRIRAALERAWEAGYEAGMEGKKAVNADNASNGVMDTDQLKPPFK